MDKIAAERKKIDAIDRQILRLVSKRLSVACRIGKLKNRARAPVLDAAREKRVRQHWRSNAKAAGVRVSDAIAVLRVLIAMSKTEQKKVKQ